MSRQNPPPRYPEPPSASTPNVKTYPAYEHWIRTSAGIFCPKVQVVGFHGDVGAGAGGLGGVEQPRRARSASPTVGGGGSSSSSSNESIVKKKSRQHRGLYATARIEPGERFLRVPARTLMGEEMLRERGQRLLEEREAAEAATGLGAASDTGDTGSPPTRRRKMEDGLIMLIEEIRALSVARGGSASPSRARQQHQHADGGWKADDSVALFLVGCRKIQRVVPWPGTKEEEGLHDRGEPCLGSGDDDDDYAADAPSFVPHVSMLPHSFPTNRLYYTPEELERMGGEIRTDGGKVTRTDMLRQIEADWQELVDLLTEYYESGGGIDRAGCDRCRGDGDDSAGDDRQSRPKNLCSCFVLDPKVDLTLDAYKWALSNIYSRSTDFQWKDEGGSFSGDEDADAARDWNDGDVTSEAGGNGDGSRIHLRRVIAPMVDMMNHDFASQVRHTMDRDGNISLYNGFDQPIEPQTEILLNYGVFPNEKLLLVYGFFFFFSSD